MPNLTSRIGNLLGITGKGQATKANSFPVVLPSDQDAVPVSVSNPTTNPETGLAKDDTLQALNDQTALLKRLVKVSDALAVVDANQRQRVTVEVLPTLGTVNTVVTVSTVSNLGLIANVDPRYLLIDIARNTYANGIRSRIV